MLQQMEKEHQGHLLIIFFMKYGLDVSIWIDLFSDFYLSFNVFLELQGSSVPDDFNQKWKDDDDEEIDQKGHIVVTSTVPIQMLAKVNGTTKILYQNILVNSPVSCRPLRFNKVKENRTLTQGEVERLKGELKLMPVLDLTPNISIKLHAIFSMNDQKVISDVLGLAYSRCPLCHLTGQGMTSFEEVFALDPEALEMICISMLHFGLRCLDFLLKIGYHKTFKVSADINICSHNFLWIYILQSFQNNTKLEIFADEYEANKEAIQKAYWEKKSIKIDMVRKGGGGNTMDGNVSLNSFGRMTSESVRN